MKLELHIDGEKQDVMGLDFVYTNIYDRSCLLKNAIEKLKMENRVDINAARRWEIFLIQKSKMQ